MYEMLEDILEGDFEERAAQFVRHAREDQDWTRDVMLSLYWKLRKRTDLPKDDSNYLHPTSIKTYFKPLRKLLEMNNVAIPWGWIQATYPERNNILGSTRQKEWKNSE